MMRTSRSVACAFLSRSSVTPSTYQSKTTNINMPFLQSFHTRLINSASINLGGGSTPKRSRPAVIRNDSSSFSSSSSMSATSSSTSGENNNVLSSARGRNAVSLLPVYLTDARAVTKYHPIDAPNGALQLSVAENQMLEDLLVPALRKFASSAESSSSIEGLFHSDQIYYQPTHGREGLRVAMSKYLHRILQLKSDQSLDIEGMVLGAGCNAVLENLCFCLTEPGDAVLIPTPYYAAFEFDLVARAALNIVPVNTMQYNLNSDRSDSGDLPKKEMYYPNRASLDAAYDSAKANGSNPKILLLSHPNNPLGVCYPSSVIEECIDWARERKVHLVSDEIYAGSVYENVDEKTGDDSFNSVLALASKATEGDGLGLGPYIHFVYALSKDFALSGLRVGVAYSENEEIQLPMQKLNDLCQISSQTQLMVENMLSALEDSGEDSSLWSTEVFLPDNHDRIRSRSNALQECLDDCGIPYLKGDSGLFLWMDFSQFLPALLDGESSGLAESSESMDRRERVLYLDLMKKYGLLFTPGRSMRNELPGFFRCVFTAASDEEFALGLKRIREFVSAQKK